MIAQAPTRSQEERSLFMRKSSGTVVRAQDVSVVCRQQTGVHIKPRLEESTPNFLTSAGACHRAI